MPLSQIRRIRWAVRATLTLGVAASVAANILHARPNPISQIIAAWPPLALLLTVELISRIPVHRRSLAAVRLVATATIAGIAAWVSYWHMVGVAARYGETGPSPYLLPLSVDGLVLVASVSLVELAGRLRSLEAPAADGRTAAAVVPVDDRPVPAAAVDPAPVPVPVVDDRPLVAVGGTEAVRTDGGAVDGRTSGRRTDRPGRLPATIADAVAAAAGQTDISRDELARRLRARGRSVANDRLPALLDAVRASGQTPASPSDGRTCELQPAGAAA